MTAAVAARAYNCLSCPAYRPNPGSPNQGECWNNPPVPLPLPGKLAGQVLLHPMRPPTLGTDWCMQHPMARLGMAFQRPPIAAAEVVPFAPAPALAIDPNVELLPITSSSTKGGES